MVLVSSSVHISFWVYQLRDLDEALDQADVGTMQLSYGAATWITALFEFAWVMCDIEDTEAGNIETR